MRPWWRDFVALAGWYPTTSALAVLMTGSAALLEGIGLSMLLPVLDPSLHGTAGQTSSWTKWLPADSELRVGSALAFFLMFAVGGSLVRLGAEALLLSLRTKIEHEARERMGRALLGMSWPHFVGLRLGDISKAQIMEGLQIGVGTQVFLQGLGAMVAAIAYIAIAATISAEMTLYTVAFGLVGAGAYALASRWASGHADALSQIVSSIGERMSDVFSGLKFIRSAGLVPEAARHASALYGSWRRAYFMSQIYGLGTRHVFEVLGLVFIAGFLFIVSERGPEGIGAALVFLAVFYRLAPRMLTVQESFFQARTYHSWFSSWSERYKTAMGASETVSGNLEPSLRKSLVFDGILFSYPDSMQPALQNIHLTVPAGQCLAIVGISGSGKTTLLDLVTGLLRPTEGDILVDGCALSEINLESWRRGIGLVMQDTPIIHGTVLENIVWGGGSVDSARARQAAEMAYALDFIERMPQQFTTLVGERGGRLSGGQRQRIALARALYRQPQLLILDEPTSALDSESESAVQEALKRIKGHCTILLVAHRLKTVQFADRIVVIEDGRVVEDGDWTSLTSRPTSKLRELVEHQQLA